MFYEDILISFDNKLSDVHVKKAFTNNIISYITKEGYYLAGMIVFLSFRMGRQYFKFIILKEAVVYLVCQLTGLPYEEADTRCSATELSASRSKN